MDKLTISATIIIASVALAGCLTTSATLPGTAQSSLQVTVQTDIQTALDTVCPVAAVIQADFDSGTLDAPNRNIKSAMATIASFCPPNLPPTNVVTATADLVSAFIAIQPILAQIKK